MRWLALILLGAVVAVAIALYDMAAQPGKDGWFALSDASGQAPPPELPPTVRPVPDWTAALTRHDPPLPAPAEGFQTAAGQATDLAAFQGQGLVVNLWATWCAPCVREMPSLARLQQAVADDGIAVLTVSSDRGGIEAVGPFWREHGLDALTPYLDPTGTFTRALAGRGLPRTYILNAAGQIAASYIGPAEWDDPALVAAVRELAR